MISYAYERVSSKDQYLERQEIAIREYRPEIAEANIFRDKLTGKNFDRENYQAMKIILQHLVNANDSGEIIEVIFEELDRLGRNAEGIKKELEWFKERGICVRILEIPTTLVDIDASNKWLIDVVNQILIEIYSMMAQQELEKRAKRQAEGIEVAKNKGVKFGRKPINVDKQRFAFIHSKWKAGDLSAVQAMKELNLKPNTFYRRSKEYETELLNFECV